MTLVQLNNRFEARKGEPDAATPCPNVSCCSRRADSGRGGRP